MTSPESDVREALAGMTLPLCEGYMYGAIRHVTRNVETECFHQEHEGECGTPGRYDGAGMAKVLNAAPALLAIIAGLRGERDRLLNAVTEHRDQKDDDRCWLDDAELYAACNIHAADSRLPPKDEFLANCARFHASRQNPFHSYVTVEERLARAREDEREECAKQLDLDGLHSIAAAIRARKEPKPEATH